MARKDMAGHIAGRQLAVEIEMGLCQRHHHHAQHARCGCVCVANSAGFMARTSVLI